MSAVVSSGEAAFLVRRRVARLSTADAGGEPHAIPVCFAYSGESIYIALDEKPKDVSGRRLKRVRNILENPKAALIADRYDEDWTRLAFVMVRGDAELLETGTEEHGNAVRLLRGKYHQYESMKIEENPVISLRVRRTASWGDLSIPEVSGQSPVLEAALGRRSVRRYLDREVPNELVREMLEAARWAPSPHGTQPWRFAVVRGRETKERLAGAMGEAWRENLKMDGQDEGIVQKRLEGSKRRLLDAPVLAIFSLYARDLDRYPDTSRQESEETMAVQSLGAAAQNALLAAYERGLDTGWMCAPLFSPETVAQALGFGPELSPQAIITLGYPDGDPPKRRSRKPLEELIVYED